MARTKVETKSNHLRLWLVAHLRCGKYDRCTLLSTSQPACLPESTAASSDGGGRCRRGVFRMANIVMSSRSPLVSAAVLVCRTLALMFSVLAFDKNDWRQPEDLPACSFVAAEFVAFVATGWPGSRQLCIEQNMVRGLGTVTVRGHQNLSIVGVSAQLQKRHPRFFGRIVLDDGSDSRMLLRRITIASFDASQLLGCGTQPANIHCLGGAAWVGEPTELTSIDSVFRALNASDGGAIYIRGGTVLLRRTVFEDAHSIYSGGAIFMALTPNLLTIIDSVFISNSAGRLGGAILAWNSSALRVCNTSFCANHAQGVPGLHRSYPSGPAIDRCVNDTFVPTDNGQHLFINCVSDNGAAGDFMHEDRNGTGQHRHRNCSQSALASQVLQPVST